jgi:lipopolysaccharide transport system permease protein
MPLQTGLPAQIEQNRFMMDFADQRSPVIRRASDVVESGTGIRQIWNSLLEHRSLVKTLARREMSDMHAGQLGGAIWIVIHPLLLLVVYAFLFTIVLKVRIGEKGPDDYLVYLFAGLAPWLLTQDVMIRSAGVMLANISIVKKVMFPIDVLVAKTMCASTAAQSILLIAVCATAFYVRGTIPWTFALLPLLVVVHIALLAGLAFLLASITPYFRDTPELLRIFTTINVFLIPAMYLPQWVPESLRFIVFANPFSHLVWCYQDVIYFNAINHPWSWLITLIFSGLTLAAGSAVFIRLRHHMASVL